MLAEVDEGWRFFRRHGATVRRARALCLAADVLDLRRPRDWPRRAERLYRRAARDLDPLVGAQAPASGRSTASAADAAGANPSAAETGAGGTERPSARRAHRLLWAAQAAYRRAALVLVGLAAALAASVASIVLVVCLLSPAARARLFPPDLCAHRPWFASSAAPPNSLSGIGPSTTTADLFFHTTVSDHPWIEIDLGAPRTIRSLLIENRRDCCEDRALPINLEILDEARGKWRVVAQRRAGFYVWTHSFAPVRARRVRVRLAAASGILHLKRISLYQW